MEEAQIWFRKAKWKDIAQVPGLRFCTSLPSSEVRFDSKMSLRLLHKSMDLIDIGLCAKSLDVVLELKLMVSTGSEIAMEVVITSFSRLFRFHRRWTRS